MGHSTYRAAVLRRHGSPLEVEDLPRVDPRPGSVTIDVEMAGVCGTDVHLQDGKMTVPLPLVLGHEAVGRVRHVGAGVTHDANGLPLSVGDLVTWASSIPCGTCFYCVEQQEKSLCESRTVYGINAGVNEAIGGSGGYGEEIILRPGSTVIRLPDGITATQLIALGCAGPTVVHGLLGFARPEVGETVVVQGCGPVGLAAAIYAKLCGAGTVIMCGAPQARLTLARSLGACDIAIDLAEEPDAEQRVTRILEMTPQGRGADLVVEATGVPSAVDEGMRMCRRNGRYLVVGQYTDHGPTLLNPHIITKSQLKMFGSWAFSGKDYLRYVASLPQVTARFDLDRLITRYPLEQVNDALDDMRRGKALKAVIAMQRTAK